MIKLTVNPLVLQKLTIAFPKPSNCAQKALDKYCANLEHMLIEALTIGQTEYERKLDLFSILVNQLRRSCRIGPDKQWLHDWLLKNNLNLIKIIEKGSNLTGLKSVVSLTEFVTMDEQFSLEKLIQKQLSNSCLSDASDPEEATALFNKLYPMIHAIQDDEVELEKQYDSVKVNIKSVESYLDWLVNDAKLISKKNKNAYARHAQVIIKISKLLNGQFIQKKIESPFGRTYYEGISIQSVNKQLRRAMLGDAWEYDIKSSVITWKMGFSLACYQASKSTQPYTKDFFQTQNYLSDKKDFMLAVRNNTFINEDKYTREEQEKILKQAITAICFGATVRAHGWRDTSGQWQHASINTIIKDTECRKRFTKSAIVKKFIAEQKQLDDYIFTKLKNENPQLASLQILTNANGRLNKAKFLAYAYQHAETHVMNVVRAELAQTDNALLANIHDAIVLKNKLTPTEKSRIEMKMQEATGNEQWQLGEKKLEQYNSVNREAINEEKAHKQRIALEEARAKKVFSSRQKDDLGTSFEFD